MARLTVLASLLLLALGTTTGCSEANSTNGPSGNGDVSAFPDVQSGDSDAAGNGDIAAIVCVPMGSGECDTAAECGTGKYCDPCTHTCEAEREVCDPCTTDQQCKLSLVDAEVGSVCLPYAVGGSFCGRYCLSNAGCPFGYTCESLPGVSAKQCVPKTKSCAPNSGACKTDADCPWQTVCNSDYGVCVKGCTADEMCTAGKVCSLGRCVEPCDSDDDCKSLAQEAICKDTRCKIPGGCLASEECEMPETHCNMVQHKCVPGCIVDADCKDFANKCDGGKCVKKGCTANWECAFAHKCDLATGDCVKAEGKFCEPCNPEDENVPECGGKPERCFSFQDADGNDKGSFCGITCSDDPAGPCPQGWACQELKDDQGASQGKYCLRQCYQTPVQPGGTAP